MYAKLVKIACSALMRIILIFNILGSLKLVANVVHLITPVQLEWSLWTRDVEDDIIPTCRDLGIGIIPYSPLGRGCFAGKAVVENLHEGDSRLVRQPRFRGENCEKKYYLNEFLL